MKELHGVVNDDAAQHGHGVRHRISSTDPDTLRLERPDKPALLRRRSSFRRGGSRLGQTLKPVMRREIEAAEQPAGQNDVDQELSNAIGRDKKCHGADELQVAAPNDLDVSDDP